LTLISFIFSIGHSLSTPRMKHKRWNIYRFLLVKESRLKYMYSDCQQSAISRIRTVSISMVVGLRSDNLDFKHGILDFTLKSEPSYPLITDCLNA
jgi:hypothetical protein